MPLGGILFEDIPVVELITAYLLACQVVVSIGLSGLCCCVPGCFYAMSFCGLVYFLKRGYLKLVQENSEFKISDCVLPKDE